MATKKLPSRIVVPGYRKGADVGGYNKLGAWWLFFGDPSDLITHLNRQGMPQHGLQQKLICAKDRNAILILGKK